MAKSAGDRVKPQRLTVKSQAAFEAASKVLAGGVNSPVRAFGAVGGTPRFIAKAEGAVLTDVDGNNYVDYVGSWGPLILGHADERVAAAAGKALDKGWSYGAPTEVETRLAECIIGDFERMDKIRFVSSGTEATMSAIRLARGFTGRDCVIKIEGCYHGHSDSLLVKAGSGLDHLRDAFFGGRAGRDHVVHPGRTVQRSFGGRGALQDTRQEHRRAPD